LHKFLHPKESCPKFDSLIPGSRALNRELASNQSRKGPGVRSRVLKCFERSGKS
jgi:hypothetical protein